MFKPDGKYPIELHSFLAEQNKTWELCRSNYDALKRVLTKEFTIDGNIVRVQFNPARLTSTSAKVDSASITARKCFLCRENRPPEQNDFHLDEQFYVLVNPFPIFPEHFTVTLKDHLPQEIGGRIKELLRITSELTAEYIVFYNGPKCGASAPDHFHFQAGNKDFLPLFDADGIKSENILWSKKFQSASAKGIDDGLRKFVLIESPDRADAEELFVLFDSAYRRHRKDSAEPLYNLVCAKEGEAYKLVVLLRAKHRPGYYFAEGPEQVLLSPASVDVCGVCITPREEDFNKVNEVMLKNIFSEVFISREELISSGEIKI